MLPPTSRTTVPRIRSFGRPLACGVLAATLLWLVIVALAGSVDTVGMAPMQDARAYWTAPGDLPYSISTVGQHHAYLYSPAFLQLVAPLRALPWELFAAAWGVVLLLSLAYLAGPAYLLPLVVLTVPEVWGGNITLPLALAIVLGFRWPATWAFVVLTKVTPGIGLLWFLVRREWRELGIALGATALVMAASFAWRPQQWFDWVTVLTSNATTLGTWSSIPIPLLVRLPVAAAVVVWAARGDRRWALPIGCMLAMPVIWYGALAMLVAIIPLAHPAWAPSWRRLVPLSLRLLSARRFRHLPSAAG